MKEIFKTVGITWGFVSSIIILSQLVLAYSHPQKIIHVDINSIGEATFEIIVIPALVVLTFIGMYYQLKDHIKILR